MVYLDHRSFLPSVDALRYQHLGFPRNVVGVHPVAKTVEYVDAANGRYSAALAIVERRKISQETGCKGPYSLRRLPFHNRYLTTPTEPMHFLKNIAEHIVKVVSGLPSE